MELKVCRGLMNSFQAMQRTFSFSLLIDLLECLSFRGLDRNWQITYVNSEKQIP